MPTANLSPAAALRNVDPKTLAAWLRDGQAVLVDVREPAEHAAECLAGAISLPLSRFDVAALPPRTSGQRLVLHCKGGMRSAQAGKKALTAGLAEVWHLEGGIEAWKRAGLPTTRPQATAGSAVAAGASTIHLAPVQRQVLVIVGVGTLASLSLGVLVSLWWLLLAAFLASGLLVAGLTGSCALAVLLSKLPGNRPTACCCESGSGSDNCCTPSANGHKAGTSGGCCGGH